MGVGGGVSPQIRHFPTVAPTPFLHRPPTQVNVASLRTWPILAVERGGLLFASGTMDSPITMGNHSEGAPPWGGLLLMGAAPSSPPCTSLRDACGANLSVGPDPPMPYGGNVTGDSSGVVRYVRVFRGHQGVALFAVGGATVVEHCESAFSGTDGFTIQGGGAHFTHVSALFATLTAVRIGGGFGGTLQFVFAVVGLDGTVGIEVDPPADCPEASLNSTLNTTLDAFNATLNASVDELASSGSIGHTFGSIQSTLPHPQLASITVIGGGSFGKGKSLLRLGRGTSVSVGSAVLVHGHSVGLRLCSGSNATQSPLLATPSNNTLGLGAYVFLGTDLIINADLALSYHCPPAATVYPPPPLQLLTEDASLAHVDSSCLSHECLLRSFFNPLPTAEGLACSAGGGTGGRGTGGGGAPPSAEGSPMQSSLFFSPVECLGAFPTPHPQANWLAGWTYLFPRKLGVDSSHALPLLLLGGSSLTQITIDTSSFQAAAAAHSAVRRLGSEAEAGEPPSTQVGSPGRRLEGEVASYFNVSQCENSGFSGVGPSVWFRFEVPSAAQLVISTCSGEGVGFDTDLSLFQAVGGAQAVELEDLQQLTCNGDGYGLVGCQPLYSRLEHSAQPNVTYLVAVGGFDSSIGTNVTLSILVANPPSPPTPPSTPSPPPPLVQSSELQNAIEDGPDDTPFVITVRGYNEVNATLRIPAPKRVVIRGANSSRDAVLSGRNATQLFQVASGASLYLSNLALQASHQHAISTL